MAAETSVALDGGIGDVIINTLYVLELAKKIDAEHEIFVTASMSHKALCELFQSVFAESQLISRSDFTPEKFDLVISINVQFPVVSAVDSRRIRASSFLAIERVFDILDRPSQLV